MKCEGCPAELTRKQVANGTRWCSRGCFQATYWPKAFGTPEQRAERAREVRRAISHRYYERNREAELARHARYRAEDPERRKRIERQSRLKHVDRARAACRKWNAEHPGYQPAWRAKHPEKVKEHNRRNREWARANPEKIYEKSLRNKYGITLADRAALIEAQGGVCAACGDPEGEGRNLRFVIDHCHKTGLICGVIHDRCNRIAGNAADDPDLLGFVARYVRDSRASLGAS